MIFGPETAVAAVAATLRAGWASELAQLLSEKGDGLAMPTPGAADVLEFFSEALDMRSNIAAEVACLRMDYEEESAWTPADISAGVLAGRAMLALRISVRNMGMQQAQLNYRAGYRAVAAALRVLVIQSFTAGAYPSIQWVRPVSVEFRDADWDKAVFQGTVILSVFLHELNS